MEPEHVEAIVTPGPFWLDRRRASLDPRGCLKDIPYSSEDFIREKRDEASLEAALEDE